MVTTQCLGDLVVYNPVQRQQGIKQSHQNFHQLASQASTASTGYQHPISRDGAHPPCHDWRQISRKVDAYYNTSAHISAQHRSYCGTSANENSVRQFVHHSGRPTDCSKRKKVNINIDTGLQLRRNLNCAHSVGTSSAALERSGLGYAAQTTPLQDQHCPTHQCNFEASYPLLLGILKGNTQDFKTAPSSSSEEIDANIELGTGIFSGTSHCKRQEQKSSPAALNCGKTMTQIMDLSMVTDSTAPCQQRFFSPLSSQPSRDEVLPAGEMEPPTDDQIKVLIKNYVMDFRENQKVNSHSPTYPNKEGSFLINGRDSTLHSDIMPKSNSVGHCPTTSYKEDGKKQSLNHGVIEQRSAAVGQALEEDNPKDTKANAVITPRFKETGDCAFASEKHSKATLASVGNSKHAPETKPFERSVSVNFNLTVKTHQSVTGDHKLVYPGDSEDKTFLGGNWNLQNGRLTTPYYSLTPLKEQIASHESIDTIAHMDNFPTVILKQYENGDIDNINLFISTESRPLTENVAATCIKKEDKSPVVLSSEMNVGQTERPSTSTLRRKSVKDQQHCSATCKEGFVHPMPKLQIHNLESDTTNQSEQLCNKTSHEGAMKGVGSVYTQTDALSEGKLREHAPLCEDGKVPCLQIEDISDDEDVSQLATEVPNTEHKKMGFPLVEYEDISGDENPQIENMAEDEADDQMNDDLIVIPISMTDIKFEPEEDALSDAGTGDKDEQCDSSPSYCELPASASSPLEVFETVESFKQAKGLHFIDGFDLAAPSRTVEDGLWQERTPQRGDLKSESEDSCDTEDSCDYSPGRERFYLSSQLLKKKTACLSTGTCDSVSEKLSDDEVAISQEGQTSFDKLGFQEIRQSITIQCDIILNASEIETKAVSNHVQHGTNGQTISETGAVILIDSDTEDESDQNCSKKAETTRLSSSGLDDRREDSPCERKRRSAETVDSRSGTGKDKFKNQGLQDPVIVLDSDSEDDNDQSYEKETGVRLSPPGSDDDSDALCVKQERRSLEFMNSKHGTAKEEPKVSRLSSGESSFPQHQSKLHNPQFKEVTRDACNDLSHSLKETGQLTGAEGSSEHAQHKTSRQTSQESKKKTKRTLSSESEDGDNALRPPKNRRSPEIVDRRHADKKVNKPSLSSQHSSKKRPQFADKEADSARHVVRNSPTKEHSKLSRDSGVSMHVTNETQSPKTPTQTSKESDKKVNKPSLSSQDSSKKRPQSADKEADSAHHVVRNSPTKEHSKLSRDSGVSMHVTNETQSPKTPTQTSKESDKKVNKPSLSSQDSSKKRPQSADKEADSAHHVVRNSPTKEHSKLSRDSGVSMHGNDETQSPKTPTQTSKESDKKVKKPSLSSQDSSKKRPQSADKEAASAHHVVRNSQTKEHSKDSRHDAPWNRDAANRVKFKPCSGQSGSTSINRSSFTSGQLSEANRRYVSSKHSSHSRETSAGPPESKKSTAIPRQSSPYSSPRQMSHSSRSCSKLDNHKSPSKGSSSSASAPSSRAQVLKSWQNSYYPTRRDKKSNTEVWEDSRTANYHLHREERPRQRPRPDIREFAPPVMKRQSSHESETPLMKRTKIEAAQRTRDINREPPRIERHSVGEGYKWSEKPKVFKPTRDYHR